MSTTARHSILHAWHLLLAHLGLPVLLLVGCGDVGKQDAADRQLAALSRAEAKLASGDADEAIALYKDALLDYPRAARAHLDLAILLHDRKHDLPGAIYHYRRYIELRPATEKNHMIDSRIRLAMQSLGASGVEVQNEAAEAAGNLKLRNEALALKVEKQQQEIELLKAELDEAKMAIEKGTFREGRPVAAEQAAVAARTYRVSRGDSLVSIASRIYGDPLEWRKIYEANCDAIPDKDQLRMGLVLVIP